MYKNGIIFTSDWHLRESTPLCRTDNFWEAQWDKVDFIMQLAHQENYAVLHGGDLFDYYKVSPFLLTTTLLHLLSKTDFYTVYGQHDLPQHSLVLEEKSGIYNLSMSGALTILPGRHWGKNKPEHSIIIGNKRILVWHKFNYINKKPYPGCIAPTAYDILKSNPEVDIICTGDNHTQFCINMENRYLINPGNITRQTADEIKKEPCIFLWTAKTDKVTRLALPFNKYAVSREHIERKEQYDTRITKFIKELSATWDVSVSFATNLKYFAERNKVPKQIMAYIYEAIDKG